MTSNTPIEKNREDDCDNRKSTVSGDNDTWDCAPKLELYLEFRCMNTSRSRRQICQAFWEEIDLHSSWDRVMARGWCEGDDVEPQEQKPFIYYPPTPCEDLMEFIDRHVDRAALSNVKHDWSVCRVAMDTRDLSSTTLSEFDRRVVAEHSAPMKYPKCLRSVDGSIM